MGGPGWLSGCFAAVMLTVAVYCAGRLLAARWWRRPTELDTDGAHVVMGVAMAGMLVSGLRTLPAGMWAGVFAAGAAWFGWLTLKARRAATATSPWRCLHAAPHLVECAAMVYMFLLLPTSAAASASGAAAVKGAAAGMNAMTISPNESRFSFLPLLLALFLLGYVVWLGDRLTGPAPAPASGACSGVAGYGQSLPKLAPRCAVLCKIAMGITMGYTLVLML
jgi:hypothetical protein